jgi:hypothetical protein
MKRHAVLAGLAFLPGSAGSSSAAQTIARPGFPTGTNTSDAGKPLSTAGPCFIDPNFVCTVNAVIPSAAVACSAGVASAADELRGSLVPLDASDVPLTSTELR